MWNDPKIRVFGCVELGAESGLSARQIDVATLLVCAGSSGVSARELVAALWGDSAPSSAGVMVRQALAALRRSVPMSIAQIEYASSRYFWSESVDSDYRVLGGYLDSVRRGLEVDESELIRVLDLRTGRAFPNGFGPEVDRFRAKTDDAYRELIRFGVELMSDQGLAGLEPHLRSAVAEFGDDNTLRRGLWDVSVRLGVDDYVSQGRGPRDAVRRSVAGVPGYLSTFVGRDHELSELSALSGRRRLVTLLGTAGIGKSRLAAEYVNRLVASGADVASVFVDCTDAADEVDLKQQVIRSVGAPQRSLTQESLDVEAVLRSFAGDRRLLLVLDNYEMTDSFGATLIARLASAWQDVSFLVTSQRAVGLSGETCLTVGAVDPADGAVMARERLDGALVGEELNSVSFEIAAEFGGVPLSIEIAAGVLRARGRRPEDLDIVAAKVEGFSRRSQHDRLASAMRWAWESLTDAQRETLMSAAQFSCSASVEDVISVSRSASAVVDLDALVEVSLISRNGDLVELVDSVRRFARFRTRRAPTGPSVRRRFQEYLLRRVESRPFHDLLLSAQAVQEIDSALVDYRMVFTELLNTDSDRARRLFESLVGVWWQGDRHDEAARWSARLWPAGPPIGESSMSHVAIALRQQDWDVALDTLQAQRSATSRSVRVVATALLAAASYGDPAAAWSLLEDASADLRAGPAEPALEGVVALMQGELRLLEDRPALAHAHLRVAMRRLDLRYSWWVGVAALGVLTCSISDPELDSGETVTAMQAACAEGEPRLVLAQVVRALGLGRLGAAKALIVSRLELASEPVEMIEVLAVVTVYAERAKSPELASATRVVVEKSFDRWTTPWIRGLLGAPATEGPTPTTDLAQELRSVVADVLRALKGGSA